MYYNNKGKSFKDYIHPNIPMFKDNFLTQKTRRSNKIISIR